MQISRRGFLLGSTGVVAMAAAPQSAWAMKSKIYTGLLSNTGAGGYDVVAYFTNGGPVKGASKFQTNYKGAKWRFASQENLDMFVANPAKYAPQYGGYCAYAVSQGYTAKGDPEAWTVHGGKLYLNFNKSVRSTWLVDVDANIQKGDANWPSVLG